MHRTELLDRLGRRPDVDVLIVGGGVTSLGTLRDLALNGVDVVLVERPGFCSGSSAASSHMAHGGLPPLAAFLAQGEDKALQAIPDYSSRELRFLALNEKVVHLDDMVLRRTSIAELGLLSSDVLPRIASETAAALGWTSEHTRHEMKRTSAIL